MLMGLLSIQSILDMALAGISLMIGLGIFGFIASVLCSAAFLQHAKLGCRVHAFFGNDWTKMWVKVEDLLLYCPCDNAFVNIRYAVSAEFRVKVENLLFYCPCDNAFVNIRYAVYAVFRVKNENLLGK
uniref:Uncharacterized protein n=1 Tax=Chenopodium quinoa TaxID=63459 RepID=A0A803L7J2_CHEQI